MPETAMRGSFQTEQGFWYHSTSRHSTEAPGEKNWAIWNKTSPGSVSSLKITVSRVIYMSTLREGKHS